MTNANDKSVNSSQKFDLFAVVDEAEKMMETNVVTALTEFTNHLILIGDQIQSRPKNASEDLAKHYKLNVTLFERLILNGMECHQLQQSWITPRDYEYMFDQPCAEPNEGIRGKQMSM